MVNINDMSLSDIIEKVGLLVYPPDFLYFCNDIETTLKFTKLFMDREPDSKQITDFFVQHEDKIDKEKLILLIINNYRESIEYLTEDISNLSKSFDDKMDAERYINLKEEINALKKAKETSSQFLIKARKLGKDIKKNVTKYKYNQEENQYELEFISSAELIRNKTYSDAKNKKRYQRIDENFKKAQKEDFDPDSQELSGIECVLQSIKFADYKEIFMDESFGDGIKTILMDNQILSQKIKTFEELTEIKLERPNEYGKIKANLDNIAQEERILFEKYIKYIDIDKLLLISAYRFEESLENNEIIKGAEETVKKILNEIVKNLNGNKNQYTFNLEVNDSDSPKEVTYSVEDIQDCMRRISNNTYLTKEYIEKTKQNVSSAKRNLEEINQEHIETIFGERELEELATLSDKNFIYVSEKQKWENEKILNKIKSKNTCSDELLNFLVGEDKITAKDIFDLYMDNIIQINQILSVNYFINFSEILSESDLNKFYQEKTLEKVPGEKTEKYTKYLSLYKEIIVKDKTRDLEEHSNNLMAEVIENYDSKKEEKHIQTIENYYKDGVLTLNSIIEWNDEKVIKQVITDLYNAKVLDLKEITNLVKNKKLPYEYVKELVWKENSSYETRKQIISEGWMPEDEILELYKKALIRKEDLEELAEKSLISKKKAEKAINNTTIKTLEGNSLISLDIGNLQKIKRNESIYNTNSVAKNRDIPKRIIDPNKREELFDLFHACRIPPKEDGKEGLEVSKDSPFYNYRFYGITDENEKINLDSVIIAERIYEDEETQLKFALDNSTYFFKYRDLLLLSNYTKKGEALKEMENMVFKANHTLATEEKNGHWGASVIYSIVKTMLSSNLKDLSKKEQRIKVIDTLMSVYTHDEIMEILDKSQEIDLGEHTYDIVDEVTTNHAESKGDSR